MKIVNRENVFETNSSAVHTLAVSNDGLEHSNLPVDKDGYISVEFGEFGKSGFFDSQIDKLSYLITQCYYLNGWDLNIDRDNYHFRNIEEAICEYTGAKGIKIVGGEPSIDHQAMPEYELNLVDEWVPKSIQSFVFNKYIALSCGCD